jgi:hypothetical protein
LRELKRELGPYAWASQYQQSPTPRAGAVVDPNGFRPLPDGWKRADLPSVQFWDLAYNEKTMADYTVAVTLVVDGDDLVVVNVYRERIAEANLAEAIAEHILAPSQTWSASRRPPSNRRPRGSWCSRSAAWPGIGPHTGA